MNSTSEKVLEILLNTDGIVSGKVIGETLSISRVAVNKQIAKLKEQGINIESRKKGYILLDKDILSQVSLSKKLENNGLNFTLFIKEVDSTNNEAKKLMASQEGNFIIVAPIQCRGRGRNSRQFVSNIGGAYMTLCYIPKNIQIMDSLKLVLVTGLAVAEVLSELTEGVQIKWPNDVYIKGKKICGILLESVLNETTVSKLILGIGINVNNELSDEIKDIATSLKLEGVEIDRESIIVKVMSKLWEMLNEYERSGFKKFEKQYCDNCISIGKNVTVNTPDGIVQGKGIGISETGYLLVENEKGINEIIVGDVGL